MATSFTRTRFGSDEGSSHDEGIFRSTDGGQTFPTNLFGASNGAPPSNFSYIGFAQSTAPDNQTLYATVQDTTLNSATPPVVVEPFRGLYVSTNGGANWTRNAGADTSGTQCQCGYDQTVAVDPTNSQRILIGFQQLYLSTDGGNSFNNVSDSKIHWDHHALYFSPSSHTGPGPNTRMWAGTDGGIHRTDNVGGSWANLNAGIATSLFRQIDIGRGSATNNKYTYGGTQDTGTIGRRDGDNGLEWHLGIDGDGGPTAVDPCDPKHVIGDDDGGYIQTTNGGDNWGSGAGFPANTSIGWVSFDPNCGVAYASIAFPDSSTPPVTQFGLARSANNGNNFITMQQFPLPVTALGTSKLDSNLFYVGLQDGTLRRTNNASGGASSNWTTVNVIGAPGGLQVGSIAVDPTNTSVVVVTYEGFTSINPSTSPTKHIFMTVDNGANWSDISGTPGGSQNYPDLPTHSVVIDGGTSPHSIIVSNDAGVMRTTNNGLTWQKYGVGLPAVDSTALALDNSVTPSLLRVGTYGRSTFELTSFSGPALAVNADLAFGPVGIGQKATRIIQLFNVGTANLNIFSFNFTSGSNDFQLVNNINPPVPTVIQPGQELDFTMQFIPTSAGNLSAVFSINSDDPNQPVFQLFPNGTGVAPKIAVSGDLNFGVVARGTKATRDITVQNTGGAPLVVSSVAFTSDSDPSFSVLRPSTPQTIAPGGSLNFTIQFAPLFIDPVALTLKTGTLQISSNDPTNPTVTLPASGTRGIPNLTVTSSLDFGSVAVDDRTVPNTVDLKLVISNQSSCSLCDVSVSGLNITGVNAGDFNLVGAPALPITIAANNSLELTIRFNPSNGGNRTATLTVASNDPVNPNKLVSLSGVGLLPAITPSPTPLIFGPTVYDPVCSGVCGQTKPEKITDSGLAQLILDLFTFTGSTAFSGPPAANPPNRVNPTQSFIEQVTFHPTGGPARAVQGHLIVTDNMGPSPSGDAVVANIPLCGESVGRGIRVIVYDTNGNIVQNVTKLSLQSHGLTNPVNIQLKNQALTTINPPTSCQQIQFQYENQNLQAAGIAAQPGSYYTLSVTVGNKKADVSFPLGVNEFKIITLTVQ